MTDESAELQLRRLLNKAIDDAWIAGFEKGKIEGRQAGIEDAFNQGVKAGLRLAIQEAEAHKGESHLTLRMKIRALLETK